MVVVCKKKKKPHPTWVFLRKMPEKQLILFAWPYVVLLQLAPEAILSVQLLIPQLYNYRIIVQLSEVTLIDFCIAPIIAVRL